MAETKDMSPLEGKLADLLGKADDEDKLLALSKQISVMAAPLPSESPDLKIFLRIKDLIKSKLNRLRSQSADDFSGALASFATDYTLPHKKEHIRPISETSQSILSDLHHDISVSKHPRETSRSIRHLSDASIFPLYIHDKPTDPIAPQVTIKPMQQTIPILYDSCGLDVPLVRAASSKTEETLERQRTIIKVNRYLQSQRFGEYLKNVSGISHTAAEVSHMSSDELSTLHDRIQESVRCKRNAGMGQNILFGIELLENISKNTLLKNFIDLTGLKSNLLNDEDFLDAIEEIDINQSVSTSPTDCIAMTIIKHAIKISMLNQQAKNADVIRVLAGVAKCERKTSEKPDVTSSVQREDTDSDRTRTTSDKVASDRSGDRSGEPKILAPAFQDE